MRLVYVNPLGLPTKKAFGYALIKMCETFSRYNPVVLTVPRNTATDGKAIFDFYKINPNFSIQSVWCLRIWEGSIVMAKVNFFIKKITFYLALLFTFRLQPDDIIYTRDLISLLILRLKTKQVYLEVHHFSRTDYYLRHLVFLANKIVVINSFLKKELITLGYPENKILIAPDAVDCNEFSNITQTQMEIRKILDLPVDQKLVVYAGNLFAWKGVYELAEAAHELNQTKVVFVGGSDAELVDFKNFITKNSLKNIIITGYRPHREIPLYLKTADVLVIPNSGKEIISKFHTSPLKLFEYMAAGVPIVASDLPSLREVVTEKNAILTEPDNVPSLVRAITRILENPQFGVQLANQALEDVREYTWEKRGEKIMNFLASHHS